MPVFLTIVWVFFPFFLNSVIIPCFCSVETLPFYCIHNTFTQDPFYMTPKSFIPICLQPIRARSTSIVNFWIFCLPCMASLYAHLKIVLFIHCLYSLQIHPIKPCRATFGVLLQLSVNTSYPYYALPGYRRMPHGPRWQPHNNKCKDPEWQIFLRLFFWPPTVLVLTEQSVPHIWQLYLHSWIESVPGLHIVSLKINILCILSAFSASQIASYNFTDQSHCFFYNILSEHTGFWGRISTVCSL